MTEALHRVPRALRVGSVVALAAALVVVGAVIWNNERRASQENFRLYDQCLSSADDVSQVRACTREFYVRRDGGPGGSDPVQLAVESTRLEQLRTDGEVEAAGPAADTRPDPTADPTDPRPAPTAPPVAAVPPASTGTPVEPGQQPEGSSAGAPAPEQTTPSPEPTKTKDDRPATSPDQPATSQRPARPPAQKPTADPDVPTPEPRPSRPKGGGKDRDASLTGAR